MISLNKEDFYETHAAYRLVVICFTCSSNRQSELNVTHANTPTALTRFKNFKELHFAYHYVMQKTAVVLKLCNVTFVEFLTCCI